MVGQVKIVGILMIVQGVLASLMGIFYAAVGPFLFTFIQQMDQQKRPGMAMKAEDEVVLTVVTVYYVAAGVLALIAGLLNVIGGIRLLKYRGRTLALIALFSNILPLFTCYCAPTSIALMVYGLIVLFNRDVTRAFEMVAAGEDPANIQSQFARRPPREDYEQDDYPR